MAAAAAPFPGAFDPGPMETIGAARSKVKAATKPNRAKPSPGSAWTAWQTERSPAARAEFLPNIASWSQGTAAQLLRQAWPPQSKRPTVIDVEARLHHHLELAARGPESTYLEALETARQGVIEELRRARLEVAPDR